MPFPVPFSDITPASISPATAALVPSGISFTSLNGRAITGSVDLTPIAPAKNSARLTLLTGLFVVNILFFLAAFNVVILTACFAKHLTTLSCAHFGTPSATTSLSQTCLAACNAFSSYCVSIAANLIASKKVMFLLGLNVPLG